MNHNILLLSMPGGIEWIFIILVGILLIILPLLAISYYIQAKRLSKENKELRERVMEKNR